ncbi:hypothetical protein GR160_10855 [Flavobacterium sp. Sd200]|uniref:hypothetical protein n=1 Tax=Flavobacterium sp. Sd200 TaxID=2692211 RepID=UPI0013696447|nr:hypothetical protein [Flavobacterium sp. Sd200]MXN91726.1 hypothetical protein [Flavobacterium sp. Sd200]
MDTIVRLKVKKDIDNKQHKALLELKGNIIAKGFTDIIHISDEGEEFHINSFTTLSGQSAALYEYMAAFLEEKALRDLVTLL